MFVPNRGKVKTTSLNLPIAVAGRLGADEAASRRIPLARLGIDLVVISKLQDNHGNVVLLVHFEGIVRRHTILLGDLGGRLRSHLLLLIHQVIELLSFTHSINDNLGLGTVLLGVILRLSVTLDYDDYFGGTEESHETLRCSDAHHVNHHGRTAASTHNKGKHD